MPVYGFRERVGPGHVVGELFKDASKRHPSVRRNPVAVIDLQASNAVDWCYRE